MKLFSSTLISWSEPWFFLLRIRESRTWLMQLLLALTVGAILFSTLFFFGWGREEVVGAIAVSLGSGFVIAALLDMNKIQRDVTVRNDYIMVGSSAGRISFQSVKWRQIKSIELLRPEDWKHSCGGMIIHTKKADIPIGVPRKLSLDTLANILSRKDVEVTLSDWQPSDADTRLQTRDEVEIDLERVRGLIDFDPVVAPDGRLN